MSFKEKFKEVRKEINKKLDYLQNLSNIMEILENQFKKDDTSIKISFSDGNILTFSPEESKLIINDIYNRYNKEILKIKNNLIDDIASSNL